MSFEAALARTMSPTRSVTATPTGNVARTRRRSISRSSTAGSARLRLVRLSPSLVTTFPPGKVSSRIPSSRCASPRKLAICEWVLIETWGSPCATLSTVPVLKPLFLNDNAPTSRAAQCAGRSRLCGPVMRQAGWSIGRLHGDYAQSARRCSSRSQDTGVPDCALQNIVLTQGDIAEAISARCALTNMRNGASAPTTTQVRVGDRAHNRCMKDGRPTMLPSFFPAGTEFADVRGVPVSCTFNGVCRAWDRDPDRQFPIESLIYEGTIITEAEFRELNRIRQTSMAPPVRHA
jgi:hypothetical protein